MGFKSLNIKLSFQYDIITLEVAFYMPETILNVCI